MNALTFPLMIDSSTPITAYTIDVTEIIGTVGEPQSRGRFKATCRESGIEITSVNAEHDICHALAKAGLPDGPVQFWRGNAPMLSHPSIHRMGRYRIALGEKYPGRVRRKAGPEISTEAGAGSVRNRDPLACHVQPSPENGRGART